jgi:hypothetical protein
MKAKTTTTSTTTTKAINSIEYLVFDNFTKKMVLVLAQQYQ